MQINLCAYSRIFTDASFYAKKKSHFKKWKIKQIIEIEICILTLINEQMNKTLSSISENDYGTHLFSLVY